MGKTPQGCPGSMSNHHVWIVSPCSDQTDPFNRSPLTMDQIRPNEELKQQILQWLDKHKQERLQLGPSG